MMHIHQMQIFTWFGQNYDLVLVLNKS